MIFTYNQQLYEKSDVIKYNEKTQTISMTCIVYLGKTTPGPIRDNAKNKK